MTFDAFAPAFVLGCAPGSIDPAIDQKAMGDKLLEEYRTRRDTSLLKLLPGSTPVWFELVPIPAPYFFDVLSNPQWHGAQREALAFRIACARIHVPGGPAWEPDPKTMVETAYEGVKYAGDEWITRATKKFGANRIREMGRVALDIAALAEGTMGPFVRVSPSPGGSAPTT